MEKETRKRNGEWKTTGHHNQEIRAPALYSEGSAFKY